jgi:hypothetical protein
MKVKGQFLELSSFKLHKGNNFFLPKGLYSLVRASQWHSSGPGSDSPWERISGWSYGESNFRLGLKKNPIVCPRPKHRLSAGQLTGYGSLFMDEAGVRGFSRSV